MIKLMGKITDWDGDLGKLDLILVGDWAAPIFFPKYR